MASPLRILSVDLEEWFHILENPMTSEPAQWDDFPSRLELQVAELLELLDEAHTKATFFVLGYVADRHRDVISEIAIRGHEIASHGYSHELVYTQTPAEFEADIERSLTAILKSCGRIVNYYRAPGFSITSSTPWAFGILESLGISVDCSIFPAPRAHGGFKDFPLNSPCRVVTQDLRTMNALPMSVAKRFGLRLPYSGGGYFRLLPQVLINNLTKNEDYVMTYFHPRDFDPNQPLAPGLSPYRRFKSYVGLTRAQAKFRAMLNAHDFSTVGQATANIDWSQTPVIELP